MPSEPKVELLPAESEAEKKLAFLAREAAFKDGLENIMTGLGTTSDKNTYNKWARSYRNLDYEDLSIRYREDWLAQKICQMLPQDMTREWRHISTPEGREADNELRIRDLFREADIWARVYGTAAIVLDLKGTGDPSTPLNLSRLRLNCIRSLQVVDRTRLMPTGQIEMNAMDPGYGQPTHYMLGGSTIQIHKSRILRYEGTALTKYENWKNQWYSDSVLIPMMNTIDNFHAAAQSAAALVSEANVDVIQIPGMQQMLTHPQGEMNFMKRMRIMKTMKSIHNLLVLDGQEVYTNKNIALNGVKDLIWEYLRIIAAAAGVPATRFLAASPDGMNATGESDLNNYIVTLRGLQMSKYDPRLGVIDKIIQAHFGIEEYTYEWNCAFPESAMQKEERRTKLSEGLKNLMDAGALRPEVALAILEAEHTYGDVSLGTPPPPPPEPKPQGAKP